MITTTDYDNKHVFLSESNIKKHHDTPVRCNHLIVIYSTNGGVKVELNYTTYNVTANTLLLLSPLDIVTIKQVSDDYKCWILVIPTLLFNSRMIQVDIDFYEKIKASPLISFDGAELEIVDKLFETLRLIRETFSYEPFEQAALNGMGILYQLYKHHFEKSEGTVRKVYESRKNTLFKKFVKELVNSYNKSREVLYYANELGVSAGYLNEVCNEVSNYSAKDIIDQAVSSRLKSELAYTDKSIQELADEYNFPSQSYFSRYYKRMTGLSPTEFRKNRLVDKTEAAKNF
ncbi:MAG: AraC family transcriptional regulator [Bacteroidaceae bacterium]|nr:AraC family transcriptional regulator [Bacteroidaceae bacterium]